MIELIAAGVIGGVVGGILVFFCSKAAMQKIQEWLQAEAANLNAQTAELLRSTENMKRLSDLKERELGRLKPRGWENPFQRSHF